MILFMGPKPLRAKSSAQNLRGPRALPKTSKGQGLCPKSQRAEGSAQNLRGLRALPRTSEGRGLCPKPQRAEGSAQNLRGLRALPSEPELEDPLPHRAGSAAVTWLIWTSSYWVSHCLPCQSVLLGTACGPSLSCPLFWKERHDLTYWGWGA